MLNKDQPVLTGFEDIEAAILTCARLHTTCNIHLVHRGILFDAEIVNLNDDVISIMETSSVERGDLEPLSLVCVNFILNGKAASFLSTISEQRGRSRGERDQFIHIQVPDSICTIQARTSFRVPVLENSGLVITVQIGTSRYHPTATNFSRYGAMLRFDPSDKVHWLPGEEGNITLRLGDLIIETTVVLRWKSLHYNGVYFKNPRVVVGADPAKQLVELSAKLEKIWQQRRSS